MDIKHFAYSCFVRVSFSQRFNVNPLSAKVDYSFWFDTIDLSMVHWIYRVVTKCSFPNSVF